MDPPLVSMSRWMDKQNETHTHSGIIFVHKKEWNSDICYDMNEPRKHYAEWKISDTTERILCDSTYMRSCLIHRDRSRLGVTSGWGGETGESVFHGYSESSLHLRFLIHKMRAVGFAIPGVPSWPNVLWSRTPELSLLSSALHFDLGRLAVPPFGSLLGHLLSGLGNCSSVCLPGGPLQLRALLSTSMGLCPGITRKEFQLLSINASWL